MAVTPAFLSEVILEFARDGFSQNRGKTKAPTIWLGRVAGPHWTLRRGR
jgi:hypothetical protein